MSTLIIGPRQEIDQLLDSLPEESLSEVLNFLQYLNSKRSQMVAGPYRGDKDKEKIEGTFATKLGAIHQRLRMRGYHPRAKAEIDAQINAERDSWGM
jgi:hypothetical protein